MTLETATLAGGCFWCMEAIFQDVRGVERIVPGYCGGSVPHPSYEQVCTGATGHAESVQITFDPVVLTYADLLRLFFAAHDPTTLNRQGPDVGTQYRSVIFYHTPEQQRIAHEVIRELEAQHLWDAPIVTQVVPATAFYPAEAYHVNYYRLHPDQAYCRTVINPKVAKFRQHFAKHLVGGGSANSL